ncbi:MAG: CpXC domain-containing protein, partial [Spirochaetota bacterium]
GIDIFLIPEAERNSYLAGRISYETGKRAVIGYPELLEKLVILRNDLDDEAIEIVKYYVLQKTETEAEIKILFDTLEGANLVFHIYGLKAGEIGISRITRAFYDKVISVLADKRKEEPFDEILHPPYISIRKI